MADISANNSLETSAISAASKSVSSSETNARPLGTPLAGGMSSPSIPSVQDRLYPVCPNPEQGFQPLSPFQVERITKRVIDSMKELCKRRHIALDLKYWKRITHSILSSMSTETIQVVSAPAGSGKSTWIEAFSRAYIEISHEDPELAAALVGITIVLQKVEDLNRLAEVLNADASEDTPYMVSLQGWSVSGQKCGFCPNFSVTSFDECHPKSCPHAQSCELQKFRSLAATAPIIGLTQERFVMLREGGNLNTVLYRQVGDGQWLPRRYLIFDEKYPMAQISTLDKDCIDQASIEFSQLIGKISAADSQVRSLQQSLSYLIDRPFQAIRRSCCLETEKGRQDIQAGFCTIPKEYMEAKEQVDFQNYCDLVLSQKKQYATKHLRTALTVMAALYSGKECLYSKTNGFAITCIEPPPSQYGESQSIIFDATAEIDEDYRRLQNVVFSKGIPKREARCLYLHVFRHKDLNVSKAAMDLPWKLSALSQLIAKLMKGSDGDVFLCSYKNYAETLADCLRKTLSDEEYRRILLMPDREHDTVPYFGGTNGSNIFHGATTVFVLGFPRLNPRDYLIYASAAYGEGQIADDLAAIGEEKLASGRPEALWAIPSIQTYMAHQLAARMEQEIFRCALRSPDYTGEVNVYLFRPPEDMLSILCVRLKPEQVIHYDELPACVEVCKNSVRSYGGKPTQYGRLVQFLAGWDGRKITVQHLREELGISPAVWKDLMGDKRVLELLAQYQIQRGGRGRYAFWHKPNQEKQCA